jgi:hypothetical protein
MHLRLIVSNGRLLLTIDEKWDAVRSYYQRFYKDPVTKQPIYFKKRLEDAQIEDLYKNMEKLKRSIWTYLDHDPAAFKTSQ